MNHYIQRILIVILLFSLSVSCSVKKDKTIRYKLILEDHFDGKDYNTGLWSPYPVQNAKSPWNRFVMDDKTLTEVKDGNVLVRARWNTKTDLPETGAIQTKDKFSFKYGKVEVRAKFNRAGQGGWPAIWLMPQNQIYGVWPKCGEIDIMERLNTDDFVNQVVHQSDNDSQHISSGKTPLISPSEYNIYSVVKLPNRIEFYVNNQLTMVHEPKDSFKEYWPFETDFYIILNHACADKGGSGNKFWPGFVTSTENFPYEMAVDYVKVWEIRN
ncbi:glycoside hydrolase family 16 protein [uncultured Flavobacterium sp.]|uniref:glycoside hydrolase family 16 protein n=1 Tax=uncultured Flavobacterium sp. TaxID=165435 RepID=UPI0025E0B2BC|nr:glycoside hydrolase family 16 protein [uncultured Flavobacterium sp.]